MRHRTIGGTGHISFHVGKFCRGETHCLGCGLAVNKQRAIHQFTGMSGTHINMITQHIIMFDLKRSDASLIAITGLQSGDQPATFIAQPTHFIKGKIISWSNYTTIADKQWQSIAQSWC